MVTIKSYIALLYGASSGKYFLRTTTIEGKSYITEISKQVALAIAGDNKLDLQTVEDAGQYGLNITKSKAL